MRTHLDGCGAMRRGQRRRLVALPLALIALLMAMPTCSAQAAGVRAAVVQVPSGEGLTGVLAQAPVSSLGLSNAQVASLLGGLEGSVLGADTATLTTLAEGLLAEHPQATLGELTKTVDENPVLGLALTLAGKSITPAGLLAALSPEQLSTLLGNFTEGAGAAQVQQALASLASGAGPAGEEAAALQAILTGLTENLSGEGLGKLREDLAGLPTGLSAEELAGRTPAQLAETVAALFTTATPEELQPVVGDLLQGVTWGTGTTTSLATMLGVPLETLAGSLGESTEGGFSTLPTLSGTVGETGKTMSLVDRTRGLAVGLLTPEGTEEGGSGETEGGGTPAGGGLTVTIVLPAPSATQAAGSGTPGAKAKALAKLRVLSWRTRGRVARIVLLAPAAGTLTLGGPGVRSIRAQLRHGGRVTVTATLSRARMAALRRRHGHLKVRLRATFKPPRGPASSLRFVVPFA